MDPLPEPRDWIFEVAVVTDLSPGMRRISLAGEGLAGLDYAPGQDMAIAVPAHDGATVRRRYTIADLDREQGLVALDFVMHGDGPAALWAAHARPGLRVEAIAPRGKIAVVPDVDWHLFAGDDTAVPAVAAMIGAIPAGGRAIAVLEIGDPADERRIETPPDVHSEVLWLHRGEAEAGLSSTLVDALAETELPVGAGHAYVAGEFGTVQAVRQLLHDRGLTREEVSPKPYWRIGRRNMPHGEPERD